MRQANVTEMGVNSKFVSGRTEESFISSFPYTDSIC